MLQGEEDALPSDIQMLKRQAKSAYGSNNILAAYDFYTHHVSYASENYLLVALIASYVWLHALSQDGNVIFAGGAHLLLSFVSCFGRVLL